MLFWVAVIVFVGLWEHSIMEVYLPFYGFTTHTHHCWFACSGHTDRSSSTSKKSKKWRHQGMILSPRTSCGTLFTLFKDPSSSQGVGKKVGYFITQLIWSKIQGGIYSSRFSSMCKKRKRQGLIWRSFPVNWYLKSKPKWSIQ